MNTTHTVSAIGYPDILDYYDNISVCHSALKALGSLVGSSTMELFTGDGACASEQRAGLQQIITLVVEQQERELADLLEKAKKKG